MPHACVFCCHDHFVPTQEPAAIFRLWDDFVGIFYPNSKIPFIKKTLINLISCAAIIFTISFSSFGGQFYGDPRTLSVAALLLAFSFTQIDLTRSFL